MKIGRTDLPHVIEASREPSRQVDRRFHEFVFHEAAPVDVPAYSSSMDIALEAFARAFPDWQWLRTSPGSMTVYRPVRVDGTWAKHHEGFNVSPALALMAAMTRAHHN